MFSSLRNRFGAPGVIAIIALVFAMVGGAWAAKGGVIIKKLSQISPSVQKQLKGKAGPPGPAGPTGSAGAKGDTGAKGDPGAAGKSVALTTIPTGVLECEEFGGVKVEVEGAGSSNKVCNGQTGFTETLPEGKTETGAWSARVFAAGLTVSQLPFAIPLSAPLDGEHVHIFTEVNFADFDEGGAGTVGCTGSKEAPSAPNGHLCIYGVDLEQGGHLMEFTEVDDPGTNTFTKGASVAGAMIQAGFNGFDWAAGTYAVTG
jgi:hypothetical protein